MRSLICLLSALCIFVAACAETADAPHDTPASRTAAPSATPGRTGTATIATPISTAAGLTSATVTDVVDGDTIKVEIAGQEFTLRYIGIDTPETVHPSKPVQCFGPEASAYNRSLMLGESVRLEKDVSETDQFGRLLRYVYLETDGAMVNETLVRDGYAYAATFPPDVRYQERFLAAQTDARNRGAGLWGASCETSVPTPVPSSSAGPGSCEYSGTSEAIIKGNISSSGEKIYHVPGQENYEITVVSEDKGERWFCTEADAVAAGWRKARL